MNKHLATFVHRTLSDGGNFALAREGESYLLAAYAWMVRLAANDDLIEEIDDDELPGPNDRQLKTISLSRESDDGLIDGLDAYLVCRPRERPVEKAGMKPPADLARLTMQLTRWDVPAVLTDILHRNWELPAHPSILAVSSVAIRDNRPTHAWLSTEQLAILGFDIDREGPMHSLFPGRLYLRTRKLGLAAAGTLVCADEFGCVHAILMPMVQVDRLPDVVGEAAYRHYREMMPS